MSARDVKNDSTDGKESDIDTINVTAQTGGVARTVNAAGIVYGGQGNTNISLTVNPVQLLPDENIQIQRLKTRTKDEIDFITAGMIRVSAVDIVLDRLKAGDRWITITGNAGDGKTVLAYLVLKELLQEKVDVFTVDKPAEYDQIAKMKERRVIMFDDRFGAFLADQQLIKSWLDVIRKFLSFSENKKLNIYVIFVSRKNVVNESRVYLGHLTDQMFDPNLVVDLSVRKVTEERLNILEYHLQREKVTVDHGPKMRVANKEIAHGFPHCCKMYSKLRSNGFDVDIEEFFKSPLKFLDLTTKVLYKDNCKDLFQMMIKNDGEFDVFTVEDEDKRQELLQVEKEQEGSYITVWKNGICKFAHPSVYESVLNVINDIDPLYCVQYATLSVIRQKVIISTSDSEDGSRAPCYIILKPIPAVLKALAERFRIPILKKDFSVFEHRLCGSREFCEALVFCCVSTDDPENGSKQFINRRANSGDTMLWTALKSGSMVAVQTLVREAGADVEMQDKRGRTPLQYLCQLKNSPAAASAADRQHHLHMETIRVIITEGQGDINVLDQYGQTPLHYLCQLKTDTDDQHRVHMATIQALITDGGGDVNIPDQCGQTSLHHLVKCLTLTREELMWILTEGKGDLNLCEQHKSTPLHYLWAYSDLQLDTAELVIKHGKGDFNNSNDDGTTPFHYLCEDENVELDVVHQIIKTAKGDLNKQDDNEITPLHVLCKGSLPMKDVLTLIKEGDKADMYGNTPLHFLCRRQDIRPEVLQQKLEQNHKTEITKQNLLGYTPLDYLFDQDDSLPWTDGMIARSAADLVLCRWRQVDNWMVVLGREMIFNLVKVHTLLQVEDFGRELTNMDKRGGAPIPGQFSRFIGTCSNPCPLHPSPSLLTSPSYWETLSVLRWRERSGLLLQMGVVQGIGNLDKGYRVSFLPDSVCVSVTDGCARHKKRLCVTVWQTTQEERLKEQQLSRCATLPHPTPGEEFTFTFGLVLDVGRGRVAFLDVERGQLLCKVDLIFKNDVFPMFFVDSADNYCATTMRLVSGREISLTDRKVQLIQQALSD